MNSGIYKIANIKTGDFYIGSALDLNGRFSVHKSTLKNNKHYNQYLQNVYNKYGLNNFLFEVIEKIENKHNLIIREQYFIDKLSPEYNLCKVAGSTLGMKHSEKTKKKIGKKSEGRKSMLGKTHSIEARKKMSKAKKGNKIWVGRKHSKKTILKLSKPFKIISPDKLFIEGVNLAKFCRDNNLNPGHMYDVLAGKRKVHKGWRNGSL